MTPRTRMKTLTVAIGGLGIFMLNIARRMGIHADIESGVALAVSMGCVLVAHFAPEPTND